MDRQEIAEVLVDADFSRYEATVYTTLLHVGDVPVADLPDICDVPRTRAYDVVRRLERRGLVETYEEASRRVRVTEPTTVVDQFDSRAESLSNAADEIQTLWQEATADRSSVTAIQQYDHALAKAASEFETAHNLISISCRPGDLKHVESALSGAIDRGVTVRIAIQDTPETDVVGENEERYADIATEVRRCEAAVPFMTLFDGPNAIFANEDDLGREYGILVRDHFLTSVFHWYYQMQLWEAWSVVYAADADAPAEYVSVHELIRDFRLTQTDESSITVRIKGYETKTGEHVELTGTIIDVVQADNTASSLDVPIVQATIVVETGDETVTVGGYGAIVEDIRGYSIRILSVD
jgi:sugar-specific transcriptional regulator TrmB